MEKKLSQVPVKDIVDLLTFAGVTKGICWCYYMCW